MQQIFFKQIPRNFCKFSQKFLISGKPKNFRPQKNSPKKFKKLLKVGVKIKAEIG